jgi:hypothetical protein
MKWEILVHPLPYRRLRWIPRRTRKVLVEAETASDAMSEVARTDTGWLWMKARKPE